MDTHHNAGREVWFWRTAFTIIGGLIATQVPVFISAVQMNIRAKHLGIGSLIVGTGVGFIIGGIFGRARARQIGEDQGPRDIPKAD